MSQAEETQQQQEHQEQQQQKTTDTKTTETKKQQRKRRKKQEQSDKPQEQPKQRAKWTKQQVDELFAAVRDETKTGGKLPSMGHHGKDSKKQSRWNTVASHVTGGMDGQQCESKYYTMLSRMKPLVEAHMETIPAKLHDIADKTVDKNMDPTTREQAVLSLEQGWKKGIKMFSTDPPRVVCDDDLPLEVKELCQVESKIGDHTVMELTEMIRDVIKHETQPQVSSVSPTRSSSSPHSLPSPRATGSTDEKRAISLEEMEQNKDVKEPPVKKPKTGKEEVTRGQAFHSLIMSEKQVAKIAAVAQGSLRGIYPTAKSLYDEFELDQTIQQTLITQGYVKSADLYRLKLTTLTEAGVDPDIAEAIIRNIEHITKKK